MGLFPCTDVSVNKDKKLSYPEHIDTDGHTDKKHNPKLSGTDVQTSQS